MSTASSWTTILLVIRTIWSISVLVRMEYIYQFHDNVLFNNNIHVIVLWIFYDHSLLYTYTLYILDLHHILRVYVYLYCITWHVGLFCVHLWFIQLFINSKQSIVIYMFTVWQYVLIRVVFCFGSSRKALKSYQLLIVLII